MEQDEVMKERLLNKELRRQAKEFDEEEATPTAADATPVTTSKQTQESEEAKVEEDAVQEDKDHWGKVAEEARAKPSVREQGRMLDEAEAEVVQPKRRRLGALTQRLSTAQPPNEGSSEETAYYKYRLKKFEDTLDNLIKSFNDDEGVQGDTHDINSLMEIFVAGEQV